MDHHFAERHHEHGHVYLGPPVVNHIHPYQEDHVHYQPQGAASRATEVSPLGALEPKDIVYLTSHHGMGHESAPPFVLGTQAAVIFSGPDPIFLPFPNHDNNLSEAFVAPLKRPPRL